MPFFEETFSDSGFAVANLTVAMMKNLAVFALLLALAVPLAAQDWSVGVSSGPFVFGDFLERRVRIVTGEPPPVFVTNVLSAGTRAGLAVDIERRLTDRWSIRLEGTFVNAPLTLEREDDPGAGNELDGADLDVTTFMLPVIFHINRNGAFRFHVMAGPALALYRGNAPEGAASEPLFEEMQTEFGGAFGGGVAWWMSDRFAIEGNLTDIITTSPFDREDFSTAPVKTPNPHNVHTTVGLRWRF
jgi:opacity protein-like surface antigen